MKLSRTILAVVGVAAVPVMSGAIPPLRPHRSAPEVPRAPKALYFLDNNPAGAAIIALEVGGDGSLSKPIRTPTGGKGLFAVNGTGFASQADTTLSQDTVVVQGNYLFTVSPGSNTVTPFSIPPNDPTHPVAGTPVSSGGDFPNSIAYRHDLRLACVLNTGFPRSGISCFSVTFAPSPGNLPPTLTPLGAFLPLPLPSQTANPPSGPPHTGSDIVFNPSGTALFATVKGDPSTPGAIYAFALTPSSSSSENRVVVAQTPILSRPPALLLDFSLSFINDTHAVVTDPAYGASLVAISYPGLTASVARKTAIAGQGATCWSAYAARLGVVFVFDGASPNVTALDARSGAVAYTVPGAQGRGGSLDSVVAGEFLFVLQSMAGVSVFGLQEEKKEGGGPGFIRSVDLADVGSRQGWMGLAAYPN